MIKTCQSLYLVTLCKPDVCWAENTDVSSLLRQVKRRRRSRRYFLSPTHVAPAPSTMMNVARLNQDHIFHETAPGYYSNKLNMNDIKYDIYLLLLGKISCVEAIFTYGAS